MNKTVTICGAFGGVNMGDEAIAETMLEQVARARAGAEPWLLCMVGQAQMEATQYSTRHPTALSRQSYRATLSKLKGGPLIIGGGQMLNGGPRPKGLAYLWGLTLMARLMGRPVALLGIGVRALDHNGLSRFLARGIVGRSAITRVRDPQSKAALVTCGAAPEKIEVTADVVFSGTVKASAARAETGSAKGKVYFAVHHSPAVSHSGAADYAALVDRVMATRPDSQAIIICHDVRPNYDVVFANEVAALTTTPCTIVIPDTVEDVLARYSAAALVVSSRMHPLILGLVAGAPVLPLAGSPKVADLCRDWYSTTPLAITDPQAGDAPPVQGVPDKLRAAALANFKDLERL